MFKRIALRFIRNSVTTALAGWWAVKQSDPKILLLAPVFNALGKWLREKKPSIGSILPF